MRQFRPKFARFMTARMAVVFNGLQLLLCIAAFKVGTTAIAFSMSVASLLLTNGLVHVGACVRFRHYVPGVISAVLLYIPLSLYAYMSFIKSGQLSVNGVIISGVLGLLYQAVPVSYLVLASAFSRAKNS